MYSLTRRLGGSNFYSKFLSKLCHGFGSVLINLFGSMLSWTTTLSLETLRKVLVLIKAEHEKPGCWLHCWIPKFLQIWSVLWPHRFQTQGTNMMSSFCCFSVLSFDVGARGYFKSNVAFWPSLVTSSLGEDIPKSWLLGIITPQHCFQRNGASCFVFSHLLHVRLKRNYQDRIPWRDLRPCKNWERIVPQVEVGPSSSGKSLMSWMEISHFQKVFRRDSNFKMGLV